MRRRGSGADWRSDGRKINTPGAGKPLACWRGRGLALKAMVKYRGMIIQLAGRRDEVVQWGERICGEVSCGAPTARAEVIYLGDRALLPGLHRHCRQTVPMSISASGLR